MESVQCRNECWKLIPDENVSSPPACSASVLNPTVGWEGHLLSLIFPVGLFARLPSHKAERGRRAEEQGGSHWVPFAGPPGSWSCLCIGSRPSAVVIFVHVLLLTVRPQVPHLRPWLWFCWQLIAVLQVLQQNVHPQSLSAENVSFLQSLF